MGEATWLTGRDGTAQFLSGTGRDRIGECVGNIVVQSVENTVGKRCPEWLGTRWGTGDGDNGWKGGKC